jgi:hypothetical protein
MHNRGGESPESRVLEHSVNEGQELLMHDP